MADLTWPEKRKLEQFFGMDSGYVLDFSNRSFGDFFMDAARRNIMAPVYERTGTSKANRLRTFWVTEPNHVVGKTLAALIEHAESNGLRPEQHGVAHDCKQIRDPAHPRRVRWKDWTRSQRTPMTRFEIIAGKYVMSSTRISPKRPQ